RYPPHIRIPPWYLALAVNFSRIPPVEKINPGPLRIREPLAAAVRLNTEQIQRVNRLRSLNIAPRPMTAPTAKAAKAPQVTRATSRVTASIRDVQPPTRGNADVRVFVNMPDATAGTPATDPHYAGSFTFFGTGQHGGHDGGTHSYMIDLT